MTELGTGAVVAVSAEAAGVEHIGGRTWVVTAGDDLSAAGAAAVGRAVTIARMADCRELALDLTGVETARGEALLAIGQLVADLARSDVTVAVATPVELVRILLRDVVDESSCAFCDDLDDALTAVLRAPVPA